MKNLFVYYQQIGAEIFRRALSYPARMIAKNAGVNGNVVINKVLKLLKNCFHIVKKQNIA